MKKKIFLAIFTFYVLAVLLPTLLFAEWTIEGVDTPKHFDDLTQRSIALDSNNHPHIAYGGDHLYHAYYDGSQWHYETVDSSPGVNDYASIAIDSQNKAHISYVDANYELKYATNASGFGLLRLLILLGVVSPQ
jgi:hypothetical protein